MNSFIQGNELYITIYATIKLSILKLRLTFHEKLFSINYITEFPSPHSPTQGRVEGSRLMRKWIT